MIVISDVHGNFDILRRRMKELRKKFPNDSFCQLGDMGIGFPKSQNSDFPKYFKFFAGNHDNPEVCQRHPNYLGKFGNAEIDGYKFFYLGGAWSIDRAFRIDGVSWWQEEELTIAELNTALDLYIETKPEIVLSHDGPFPATHYLMNRFALQTQAWYKELSVEPTRTGQALSAMFEAHQPKLWIFAHWHDDWEKNIKGTKFICMKELGSIRIEDLVF